MQQIERLDAVPGGHAHGLQGIAGPPAFRIVAAGVTETPAGDDDASLVARAQKGERAAFETLLRRHYDRMHRVAWRMTGSRHDAEDVVQDVCCALVGKLGSFRGESRFSTWLIGIVVNAAHDHRRRGATLTRLREGLAVLVRLTSQPDSRDPHRRLWLGSALGRLEPALRDTVALVAGEGLTHAEAGLALNVAENTISWRMHEARRRLTQAFDGEKPDV